jgi:hypothetical protein
MNPFFCNSHFLKHRQEVQMSLKHTQTRNTYAGVNPHDSFPPHGGVIVEADSLEHLPM